MRLIAERLLDSDAGTTYVDGELICHKLKMLPPPKDKHTYHVCCSDRNPGALALMEELAEKRSLQLRVAQEGSLEPPVRTVCEPQEEVLFVTTNVNHLEECDHLLLFLTSQTWTRGDASEALADEIRRAMDLNVHVLLTHEMPGTGGQEARFGCEFGSFFGATPSDLLKRGVYSEVAVALKGGPWREASMMMLAMAFGLTKEEAKARAAGHDVLGMGLGFAENSMVLGLTNMHSGLVSMAEESVRQSGRMSRLVRKGTSTIWRITTSTASDQNGHSQQELATTSVKLHVYDEVAASPPSMAPVGEPGATVDIEAEGAAAGSEAQATRDHLLKERIERARAASSARTSADDNVLNIGDQLLFPRDADPGASKGSAGKLNSAAAEETDAVFSTL